MEQSEHVELTPNPTPSAEFFVRSPFCNLFFKIVTCLFVLAVLCWALIVIGSWRHLTFQVIASLSFVICLLAAMCGLGLQVHARIHVLFESGRIEEPNKGSPLNEVLDATTDMILSGLFLSLALAVLCLAVLGNMLFRH